MSKIENRSEARGARLARDELLIALRDGAMVLNGWVVNMLKERIAAKNAALAKVPAEWAHSNGEAAALEAQMCGGANA